MTTRQSPGGRVSETPRPKTASALIARAVSSFCVPHSEVCYRALRTRDERFDGRFFVGVTSTGIYYRPICPTRPAKFENCRFFPSAAAAQEAGFRPCLRCCPTGFNVAPGSVRSRRVFFELHPGDPDEHDSSQFPSAP